MKNLTKFELQLKISSLEVARDRAKKEGHGIIARECQKCISAYRRRVKRMGAEKTNG